MLGVEEWLATEAPGAEVIFGGFEPTCASQMGDIELRERRIYDVLTGVMDDEWTFEKDGERTVKRTSIRVYSAPELAAMLRRVGFSAFAA